MLYIRQSVSGIRAQIPSGGGCDSPGAGFLSQPGKTSTPHSPAAPVTLPDPICGPRGTESPYSHALLIAASGAILYLPLIELALAVIPSAPVLLCS